MRLASRAAAVLLVTVAPALIGASALPEPLLGRAGALGLGFGLGAVAALAVVGPLVRRIRAFTAAARRVVDGGELEVRADDELAALADIVNAAARALRARELEAARRDAALRDIVADATHDVILPLSALRGLLGDLGPGAAIAEVQHIAGLLRNLAAAAALEAGAAPQHAAVDLSGLLLRLVMRVTPAARAAGVEVISAVPEDTVWIDGDPLLLEQALANVLDNAVAYGRRGGHVAVVLGLRGPDGFVLRFEDDGPGVRLDELPRLTERHFRGARGRQVRPGGRGLGLHIAARVAADHGLALALARPRHGGLSVELRGRRRPDPVCNVMA